MNNQSAVAIPSSPNQWLKTYYFTRAAVSIAWIAAAVLVARNVSPVAAVLLVVYPAWDALANYLDAARSGGLRANFSQTLNLAVSLITTVGVVLALALQMNVVLPVFGAWAIFAGLFQLVTAIRRWKSFGAQWAMALSGLQSVLAGFFFFSKMADDAPSAALAVAPYAAFGAFYFLVSAVWLTIKDARRPKVASI
jgi:hypothetical protein